VPESIAQTLIAATDRLTRSGVPNAKREATALWAAVLDVKPGDVWLRRAATPPAAAAARFWAAADRRSTGEPLPYVVGRAGFRSLDLLIDPRALIPRPETEGLVDLVLALGPGGLAADIGTGCGCIALALATEGRFERIIAVERSPQAAALARENVALVRPRTPVEIREGDLLAPLSGLRYRAIVANPPYLTEDEYAGLAPSVKAFEPRDALVSGPDGLAATRALLQGAAALLDPGGGGVLALEIGERRGDAVRAMAHQYGWARSEVHHDVFGRPRYALVFSHP